MSDEEKDMGGKATDTTSTTGGEGTSLAAATGTGDEGSSVLNAEQFLEVFDINFIKNDYKVVECSLTVNEDLQEQLRNGTITREAFDKKVKDAQEFLRSGEHVKRGAYKPWAGTSDGAEIPTLTPSAADEDVVEILYEQQCKNRFSDIGRAFSVEKDAKGKLFFKSREGVSEEDVIKAQKNLQKLGWTSDWTTERVTAEDGSEHFVVTGEPSTLTEKLLVKNPYVRGGMAAIYGKGGLVGKIKGSLSQAAGRITGGRVGGQPGDIQGANGGKAGMPTIHVGTGYGDGNDIFEERVPFIKKLFSEWMTPNSETLPDFFVDAIVNFTAKINADTKLWLAWTVEWMQAKAARKVETARNDLLDKDGKPGRISDLTTKIQNGDVDGAEATLEVIRKLVERAKGKDLDIKAARKSLKEYSDVLKANRAAIQGNKAVGASIANQLAGARDKLVRAVANQGLVMQGPRTHIPTPGRGAYTP